MACTQTCCHFRSFDAAVYLRLDLTSPHLTRTVKRRATKEEKTVKGKRHPPSAFPLKSSEFIFVLVQLNVTLVRLYSAGKPR